LPELQGGWPSDGKAHQEHPLGQLILLMRAFDMPLLFSYGTLQHDHVQLSTFGRRLEGERDDLPGFEPSFVSIQDPQVVASSGHTHHANATFNGRHDSRVSGTVFEVTEAELAAADEYEQRAAYTRVCVTLASGKEAWVYVAAPSGPRAS
jgi:Gamma-glutamyl cyclotransferase, AIG2-like